MKHFKTISDYCKGINIPAPRHPHFDIRRFEENMETVHSQMPPFRHEFYALAIKADGDGKTVTGAFSDFPDGATIFFNTPFQIISWDIRPNWEGYYLIFSQDFIAQSKVLTDLLKLFPFLKIDRSIPFNIPREQLSLIQAIYERIWTEYNANARDAYSGVT
ncbi:MAG: AraC family transcriptional regulator, partial [Phaeodactylibacter sp.]|nr:AraC family transcriptional regulator [Phaeodactylibacter sp.]